MAPPTEPWAAFCSLLQRFVNRVIRPHVVSAAPPAEDVVERRAPRTPRVAQVEDRSDLLKRRMRALHLDPGELNRSLARALGIQAGLCTRCEARSQCMRALDDELSDPGWGDWRNYCPNATALSILSTLHECDEKDREQTTIAGLG